MSINKVQLQKLKENEWLAAGAWSDEVKSWITNNLEHIEYRSTGGTWRKKTNKLVAPANIYRLRQDFDIDEYFSTIEQESEYIVLDICLDESGTEYVVKGIDSWANEHPDNLCYLHTIPSVLFAGVKFSEACNDLWFMTWDLFCDSKGRIFEASTGEDGRVRATPTKVRVLRRK